jgi:hypothetical protein
MGAAELQAPAAADERHGPQRPALPLAYEPELWSIAFLAGMYGVVSHELGIALKVSRLVSLGHYEAWPAPAMWAAVSLAVARALPRRLASEGSQVPPAQRRGIAGPGCQPDPARQANRRRVTTPSPTSPPRHRPKCRPTPR